MNYIVLDLEWNQPVSYASAAYRKVGSKLLFEVIQIGAAKVDETMQIVDSISIPICPTHYLTIHPRVKRMTGLTQEILCDAPAFSEGTCPGCTTCSGSTPPRWAAAGRWP